MIRFALIFALPFLVTSNVQRNNLNILEGGLPKFMDVIPDSNDLVELFVKETPKFIDALDVDTITKIMKVLDNISTDKKIKEMAKQHFADENECKEYVTKFVALLKEFFYSSKNKVKSHTSPIISKIFKMMGKADGKVAKDIVSTMMTKIKPHLTAKELSAINKNLFPVTKPQKKADVIIPLFLTHFLSFKGHSMNDISHAIEHFIKNVPKKDQIDTLTNIVQLLHNQLQLGLNSEKVAEKVRSFIPAVQTLVEGLDDDQKEVLKEIKSQLKTDGKYRHYLRTIKNRLRFKRDLGSLMEGNQLMAGNSIFEQGKADPKVFMTMMLQNLLNDENSKRLGHFMNFFLGQFSEKFHSELFLKLYKITKNISPNNQILLDLLWNPVLKRLMKDLLPGPFDKMKRIKETFENSDDEDAKIVGGYFKNALARRKKRDLNLQLLGKNFLDQAGLQDSDTLRILGEQAIKEAAPAINGMIKNFGSSREDFLKSIFNPVKEELSEVKDFVISKKDDWMPHVQRLIHKLDNEAKEKLMEKMNQRFGLKMDEAISDLGHELQNGDKPKVEISTHRSRMISNYLQENQLQASWTKIADQIRPTKRTYFQALINLCSRSMGYYL